MTDEPLPEKFENVSYVRLEDAAPFVGHAAFFKHPEHGWVKSLDTVTDIEIDIVVAAFGDPVTGSFEGQYKTWYPDSEDIIVDIEREFVAERIRDTPDEVEPADKLVDDLRTGAHPDTTDE